MASSSPEKKQKTASTARVGSLLRVYRAPALTSHATRTLLSYLCAQVDADPTVQVDDLVTEYCFYIETVTAMTGKDDAPVATLSATDYETLQWLLSETFEPQHTRAADPFLDAKDPTTDWLVEVGPRMNFTTAWSSNAVAICHACGLTSIKRIERATRYLVRYRATSCDAVETLKSALLRQECDRMTQQVYDEPLTSFWHGKTVQPVRTIPIMERGIDALKEINDDIGLGFDDWDLQYYMNLFKDKLRRNPTDVECFDMGQSNSEHSRHWFFGGKIVVDGREMPQTLFQMVKDTLTETAKQNSIIAFHDNSSVIKGAKIVTLGPVTPGEPSPVQERTLDSHLLLTAETHNFPSGVAPFPGAETGTGGRIRDVQATGRGANVVAGISAYSVGNLNLEGYRLPWEDEKMEYPSNLAHPRDILIQASNGASDYGNKFGEPVVTGFARSFGIVLPNGERREYIKPIMFSAGLGQLDGRHCTKGEPEIQMWVVKIGGPCYRIGMGGGAASSRIQDAKTAELDFNAVQRGDAEMECKLNKVIRSCCDLGENNPIVSIHDQGAGGNGNVLKEIVEVSNSNPGDANRGGARYEVRNILVGDDTLSVLEIWGAEYQENDALLLRPEHVELFDKICKREKCPYALLGQVTGDGHVVLHDSKDDSTPFDLDLDLVLGKMPQKTFVDTKATGTVSELSLPVDITLRDALDRVLRLLSVGSKRFLTSKVDRSVSGLIAQQQTVGPLQLTLADCAVVAQTNVPSGDGKFSGVVSACGEQPIKGLVNPGAMARLSVGESLTNMVWAALGGRGLDDCKCSANWMWAAKLPNEAACMYECCEAMTTFMKQVGVAVDGGKDSLSMAAKVNKKDVKTPGTLVITMYAPTEDVELKVTPDLKTHIDSSLLYYIDVGKGENRLGGSALAQVYGQVGNVSPDVEDVELFKNAFNGIQTAIKNGHLLAGHDRSDGGLIVTLLEMAFAGNCGIDVDIPFAGGKVSTKDVIQVLFAEELGFVFQVAAGQHATEVEAIFGKLNVPLVKLGKVTTDGVVTMRINGESVIQDQMVDLRDVWEATSFELEKRQCNPECVAQEQRSLRTRTAPSWKVTYEPEPTPERQLSTRAQHRVAVLREEGSNGEREMLAAFHHAGFEVWDITMSDVVNKRVVLDERFRGAAFVGGFTFADVLGSAKGWSGVVKYHGDVLKQFTAFKAREDTFSFGACNGCQFMTLLGWLDHPEAKALEEETRTSAQPRFVHNESGRHESRFVSVQIQESNSVMLRGMAGSSMGVWVSHGEGRAHFTHAKMQEKYVSSGAAPIRYVDDSNVPTEEYPFNPNGSPEGIAGLVSSDGRHLCVMPHPERCFLKYQWPYMPADFEKYAASPWMRIFQNAKTFCKEFFQYIGPDNGAVLSSTLLNQNRLFVYSTPSESPINRCGHVPVGSYFACSAVLYYADNVWLKIRRGYFSNTQQNGYIRVHFAFPTTAGGLLDGSDLPSRQYAAVVEAQPAPFRYMRRLPVFPTYMCARDRLMLYREPVFTLHSTSMSSASSPRSAAGGHADRATTLRPMQRYVPPVSVFRATECRFNDDFTQLAIKVTMAGAAGVSGWINASFHKTLIEVEDPSTCGVFRHGPVYLQNVAGRSGKWAGELPVRAIPNLQAPQLYSIESYRVVRAIERKLLKDRVWVRIEPLRVQQELRGGVDGKSENNDECATARGNHEKEGQASSGTAVVAEPDAWIIERNANTAQRVMAPWGSTRIRNAPADDDAERYYRTVYSRRPLPLRRTADLQAEVVGHLEPGSVFASTQRVLNEKGRMWIRVALPRNRPVHSSKRVGDDVDDNDANWENDAAESTRNEEELQVVGHTVQYGYAIQSNAKTNTCMVQEIPPPGKMTPKQYYQIFMSPDDKQAHTSSPSQDEEALGCAPENTLVARTEASSSAKELFYVKNGAILSAIGTEFSAEEGRMWLQVLATELDPSMKVKLRRALSDVEQNMNVVYLPICDPSRNAYECVLMPIHRELTRIDNPVNAEKDGLQSPSRVVFSGRASKLFGSHLLRPSTIDLPSPFHAKPSNLESLSSGITAHDPTAGETDRAQSLKDEITAWQLQTGNRMTQLYTQVGSLAGYTVSCVARPFASCLAHQEAKRRYQELDQDGEGMEEYALEDEGDDLEM